MGSMNRERIEDLLQPSPSLRRLFNSYDGVKIISKLDLITSITYFRLITEGL